MSGWSLEQKQAFVSRMGKKRASFARGGFVKRKKMAAGGPLVTGAPTAQATTTLAGPTFVGNGAGNTSGTGLAPAISGVLGTSNQYQPVGSQVQLGTNAPQLNQAYMGSQQAIGEQQGLVSAYTPGATEGLGTQEALTGELQGVVSGAGPNAAQTALNANTATNVANTAALQAGQRGASGNVGLIARQAAQQGAVTQQAAVGEAATLQAQQAIAAQQQLQGLAATEVGQQEGAVQGASNAQQNEQNIIQGANTAANNAGVAMQSNINNANATISAGNAANNAATTGGILGAIGSLFAKGGEVGAPRMAAGGPLVVAPVAGVPNEVGPWLNSAPASGGGAPQVGAPSAPPGDSKASAELGKNIANLAINATGAAGDSEEDEGENWARGGRVCEGPHRSHVANYLAAGGVSSKVPAMLSPDEVYLNPEAVRKVVEDGANPMKIGQRIPGKAKKANDSLKNDTVAMDLEEGGVVIPRHITTHKMAPEKAELFVHRALARKKAKSH